MGWTGVPVATSRLEHLGGDVLVVEGDDVAGSAANRRTASTSVCAPTGELGHDERGAGVRGLGEDAQRDAELRRGAGAHPRELAAPDDADDGEPSGSTTWGGHPARIATPLYRLRG